MCSIALAINNARVETLCRAAALLTTYKMRLFEFIEQVTTRSGSAKRRHEKKHEPKRNGTKLAPFMRAAEKIENNE